MNFVSNNMKAQGSKRSLNEAEFSSSYEYSVVFLCA